MEKNDVLDVVVVLILSATLVSTHFLVWLWFCYFGLCVCCGNTTRQTREAANVGSCSVRVPGSVVEQSQKNRANTAQADSRMTMAD